MADRLCHTCTTALSMCRRSKSSFGAGMARMRTSARLMLELHTAHSMIFVVLLQVRLCSQNYSTIGPVTFKPSCAACRAGSSGVDSADQT